MICCGAFRFSTSSRHLKAKILHHLSRAPLTICRLLAFQPVGDKETSSTGWHASDLKILHRIFNHGSRRQSSAQKRLGWRYPTLAIMLRAAPLACRIRSSQLAATKASLGNSPLPLRYHAESRAGGYPKQFLPKASQSRNQQKMHVRQHQFNIK